MSTKGLSHQVMCKEARSLGSFKQELSDSPTVVPSQLLHKLREEECHLQAMPCSA